MLNVRSPSQTAAFINLISYLLLPVSLLYNTLFRIYGGNTDRQIHLSTLLGSGYGKYCCGAQQMRLVRAGHCPVPSPRACLHHNDTEIKRMP